MSANFFVVKTTPNFNLGQFRVDFLPVADVTSTKKQIVWKNKDILGLDRYTFDGASLYTATRLEERTFDGEFNGKPMQITIRRTGTILNNDDQAFQILNLIFRDAMAQLKLQNIKRNYYDPQAKIAVPEGRLELWPGYLTAIRTYENNNILLCAEIIHKFMRNETVYEIARSLMNNHRDWKDMLRKEIVGTTVLTDYTNKTYNIDDIDFDMTPRSTFKPTHGDETNFVNYYRSKYDIKIQDDRQMMLVSRARERDIKAGQPENIILIPELSRATGLTDSLRANFRLMQQISAYTRLSPEDRVTALRRFNRRIQSTPESVRILRQWELELDTNPVEFEARELPPEDIVFGSQHTETANHKAEWQIRGSTAMYSTVPCTRWIFLYPRELEREAAGFLKVKNLIKFQKYMNLK
jgi:aubergine-like protein